MRQVRILKENTQNIDFVNSITNSEKFMCILSVETGKIRVYNASGVLKKQRTLTEKNRKGRKSEK